MISRQRVRATVRGLPVDRIPVITWLNAHAACRMMAELQPATDEARNAACRSARKDFSEDRGDLPMLHSCGYQMPLLEYYVETELDILRAYRIGGRNGRHILDYTHMLQYTMPTENLENLLRTVREIQESLHDGEDTPGLDSSPLGTSL